LARPVLLALAVIVASWAALAVLASRLPPGVWRDAARFLPACAGALRALRRDPRVPRRTKLVLGGALLWVLSPIDLIPEFVPVIGPLDDVVVVVLALRYASRHVPQAALDDAWPDRPAWLRRTEVSS
jgi:uncharacterized membrane protein YkvA (DUF1232 family)